MKTTIKTILQFSIVIHVFKKQIYFKNSIFSNIKCQTTFGFLKYCNLRLLIFFLTESIPTFPFLSWRGSCCCGSSPAPPLFLSLPLPPSLFVHLLLLPFLLTLHNQLNKLNKHHKYPTYFCKENVSLMLEKLRLIFLLVKIRSSVQKTTELS